MCCSLANGWSMHQAWSAETKKKTNKSTSFESFHTVILKMQRRVRIKIEKYNNNNNNSYEIEIKPYKIKDFIALSHKIRTSAKLWTYRLIETSKRTGISDSLTRRYTGIISPLIVQKFFFYVIKIILSIYKDSKIKEGCVLEKNVNFWINNWYNRW